MTYLLMATPPEAVQIGLWTLSQLLIVVGVVLASFSRLDRRVTRIEATLASAVNEHMRDLRRRIERCEEVDRQMVTRRDPFVAPQRHVER